MSMYRGRQKDGDGIQSYRKNSLEDGRFYYTVKCEETLWWKLIVRDRSKWGILARRLRRTPCRIKYVGVK